MSSWIVNASASRRGPFPFGPEDTHHRGAAVGPKGIGNGRQFHCVAHGEQVTVKGCPPDIRPVRIVSRQPGGSKDHRSLARDLLDALLDPRCGVDLDVVQIDRFALVDALECVNYGPALEGNGSPDCVDRGMCNRESWLYRQSEVDAIASSPFARQTEIATIVYGDSLGLIVHLDGKVGGSRLVTWIGWRRSTRRSCVSISTARLFPGLWGAQQNYQKFGQEPPDHAIGRSRGGLTTKNHLVCDGKGRALAFLLTPGQFADTSWMQATLEEIRVTGPSGRPRTRPDRVMADKGYPSKANRAWLRNHGIAATIPERDDQIAHRRRSEDDRSSSVTSRRPATADGTSSSAALANSSNGAGSRCAQTRPPATTTLLSASPQPSTGSTPPLATRPKREASRTTLFVTLSGAPFART